MTTMAIVLCDIKVELLGTEQHITKPSDQQNSNGDRPMASASHQAPPFRNHLLFCAIDMIFFMDPPAGAMEHWPT